MEHAKYVRPTSETAPEQTEREKALYPNGMTEEQVQHTLAALGRRKNDTQYLKVWEEGSAEFRRQQREELERELAEEGK